jgi:hypothetical protein
VVAVAATLLCSYRRAPLRASSRRMTSSIAVARLCELQRWSSGHHQPSWRTSSVRYLNAHQVEEAARRAVLHSAVISDKAVSMNASVIPTAKQGVSPHTRPAETRAIEVLRASRNHSRPQPRLTRSRIFASRSNGVSGRMTPTCCQPLGRSPSCSCARSQAGRVFA